MSRFVVLSGCSGGGKSVLLSELSRRGYMTVQEPGRRIVAEQSAADGVALPWKDLISFARRAIEVAHADLDRARRSTRGWVFFDRGLVDAAAALSHADSSEELPVELDLRHYHRQVFMTPPWPQIYTQDSERRHTLEDAVAEHDRLTSTYQRLGYEPVTLPKLDVAHRAEFVIQNLAEQPR